MTLSHYLNNYLPVSNGGLQLIKETLNKDYPRSELLTVMRDRRESSSNIEAVMKAFKCRGNEIENLQREGTHAGY